MGLPTPSGITLPRQRRPRRGSPLRGARLHRRTYRVSSLPPTAALLLFSSLLLQGQTLPSAPAPQPAATHPGALQAPARLTGEVLSEDGALVANASVRLVSPADSAHTLSDESGHFIFDELVPGQYTLTISLPGFDPASQQLTLAPGQTLDLAAVQLSLATVSISVDAITPEQAALEQLHTEEHQRLVGVLPNFFVSYNWTAPPLTARQKFTLSTHNVLDPGNLALVGLVAGVQQAANAFPGYGQGLSGFGQRYGADLGNLVVGTYMGGAVLPSLFHQDPRYFYKGTGTKKQRFFYAISRAVITRGDNGHNQPNFAGVLGDLSAGALSNLYYPASDRQGATLFLENSILAIGGDAMNDFVQEFFFSHFTSDSRTKKKSASTP